MGKASHNELPGIRLERARSWLRGKPQGPVFLEIFPTAACNLDCRFCWRQVLKTAPQELTDQRLCRLADEAVELGVLEVCIKGGGEPILRRSFIEYAAKRFSEGGVLTQLITNGTLFDEKLCALLVDCGWDDVALSVDAALPDIHDRLRGKAGAFEKTVQAAADFKKLKRAAKTMLPLVSMHCVLTNLNYLQPGELLRLAAGLEMSHVTFDSMGMGAPACRTLALSPAQLDEFDAHIDQWLALAKELGVHTNLDSFKKKG
ncbi:MAG TPA: radical SAM protein, partial [Elusimicrobiales bacterium]|nr:radical SAM protein [Elusimicrobiales bacterium]